MTKDDKRKIFSFMLKDFETEYMSNYFMDMVAEIPDYIFTMPSSTSGKYHNKTQCQKFGQVYHMYMFASILNHRLQLEWNKKLYPSPITRDAMRCVAVFHDAIKCGWDGGKYTVPNHPMLAGEWVRKTVVKNDIDSDVKELIARLCEIHSGEWNKDRYGNEIMPKPENEMEFFIHECDFLASRSDLDMIVKSALSETLLNGGLFDGQKSKISE